MNKRTSRRFQFSLFALLGLMAAVSFAAVPLSVLVNSGPGSNAGRGMSVMLLTAGPVLAVLGAAALLFFVRRGRG